MSSNNTIASASLTELELSAIAIGLYLVISPVHGVSAITNPILKTFNIKSPTSLLLFTGLLFGISYYYLVELVLHPLYNRIKRVQPFKSGAQVGRRSNTSVKGVTNSTGGLKPAKIRNTNNTPNTIIPPTPVQSRTGQRGTGQRGTGQRGTGQRGTGQRGTGQRGTDNGGTGQRRNQTTHNHNQCTKQFNSA